jgi:hypothetical protein
MLLNQRLASDHPGGTAIAYVKKNILPTYQSNQPVGRWNHRQQTDRDGPVFAIDDQSLTGC